MTEVEGSHGGKEGEVASMESEVEGEKSRVAKEVVRGHVHHATPQAKELRTLVHCTTAQTDAPPLVGLILWTAGALRSRRCPTELQRARQE